MLDFIKSISILIYGKLFTIFFTWAMEFKTLMWRYLPIHHVSNDINLEILQVILNMPVWLILTAYSWVILGQEASETRSLYVQINANNLQTFVWFQVNLHNNKNYIVYKNYFYSKMVIHWFQVPNNNNPSWWWWWWSSRADSVDFPDSVPHLSLSSIAATVRTSKQHSVSEQSWCK